MMYGLYGCCMMYGLYGGCMGCMGCMAIHWRGTMRERCMGAHTPHTSDFPYSTAYSTACPTPGVHRHFALPPRPARDLRAVDDEKLRHAEPRGRGRRAKRALQHSSRSLWSGCRWNIVCWMCAVIMAVMWASSVGSLVEKALKTLSLNSQTIFY